MKKLFSQIAGKLSSYFPAHKLAPDVAYNMWSKQYDLQPDNLVLALDELMFSELIKEISISGKTVVDVGCGTGRHWPKILERGPGELIGYDVSKGMLEMLKQKFPFAQTRLLQNDQLEGLANKSCDILICTLTLAHIKSAESTFAEWDRVLKTGAHVVLTDYHADLLARGGDRTFVHEGKSIAIKSYIHSLNKVRSLCEKNGFKELIFRQNKIDESVKHYYEKQNAGHVYERFKGTAVIYGMHLVKSHVAV